MITRFTNIQFVVTISCLLGVLSFSGCSLISHNETDSVYQRSLSPMQDIENALTIAKAKDKALLIVLGAQWCHDRTWLAENFNQASLANIHNEQYE